MLAGPAPEALLFGLPAAVLATWVSLRLLPPGPSRLDPIALARVLGLVLRQSVLAGWDVALRAFARPPRLAPGLVTAAVPLPAGPRRDGFRLLASLAPGALPLEDAPDGTLVLHALDTGLPLAAEAETTGAAFAGVWRAEARDG